jgi:hypothetical protein
VERQEGVEDGGCSRNGLARFQDVGAQPFTAEAPAATAAGGGEGGSSVGRRRPSW